MVDNDKAIIMVGTGRNLDWPEKVPSYKHPVIVRLVNETNVVFEPIVVLQFEQGVTGYERFELRPKFLKEIANTDKFYVNAGGLGYPSLALDSKELLKAIHDLQDPNQKNNWTAHARIVENNDPKLVVLSLEDNGKMTKDQALDYFDDKVYVFDNKPSEIPKNLSEIKPGPQIFEVLKAPVQYNTENWKELERTGNESRENSEEIYKSLRNKAKEIIAESKNSGKLLTVQGNISYIEKFTKDDNLIVKGRIRNDDDLDFNFIAFGKVAESMRNFKPNDSVNFLGGFDQQNNSQIKLVTVKKIDKPSKTVDISR